MSSFPWTNDEQIYSKKKMKKGQPVKNTCPWSTDGATQVPQPRKTKPRSVCPWATDAEGAHKENIMQKQRKHAPWDDVQNGAGLVAKRQKRMQRICDNSIEIAVDDRFSANA